MIIDSPPASNVLIYFFILFRILLQSYSFAYIHLMARFGEYIKRQLWTNSIIKQNFKSKGQNIVNSTFQKKSKVVKKSTIFTIFNIIVWCCQKYWSFCVLLFYRYSCCWLSNPDYTKKEITWWIVKKLSNFPLTTVPPFFQGRGIHTSNEVKLTLKSVKLNLG